MLQIAVGVLQILYLVLKNKFERDAEIRKQKESLHDEAKDAIKSGDADAINSVILKLRT